jgi:hypothetical protein
MREKNMIDIVKKLFNKKDLDHLSGLVIIDTPNGYELFGEYAISKVGEKFKVNKITTYVEHNFFSLQNAVVWATLDKRNKVVDRNRVTELDMLLEGTKSTIELQQVLTRKAKDDETKLIYFSKLNEALLKKKQIVSEITKYIDDTKKWQEIQFSQATK